MQGHLIYNCKEFLALSIPQRWEKIKNVKLCCNCNVVDFLAKFAKKRHNSLLHEQKNNTGVSVDTGSSSASDSSNSDMHMQKVNLFLNESFSIIQGKKIKDPTSE